VDTDPKKLAAHLPDGNPAKSDEPVVAFEQREGYAFAQVTACVSLDQAAEIIANVIATARERGFKRLLIDGMQLTGFPGPNLAERYFIVRHWARTAERSIEVALVLQAYLIDPARFGVVVARNFGLRANVFALQDEAVEWLLGDQR